MKASAVYTLRFVARCFNGDYNTALGCETYLIYFECNHGIFSEPYLVQENALVPLPECGAT